MLIVPCVWFRRDFSKDSNGHLQCKTRSSTLPSPRFHWLFVDVRQIQEQCGLSYLLKVYIPSLLKQVRKQPLLRTAIPDLTPGAPARSVCVQTTSLTLVFLYMITSGYYCTPWNMVLTEEVILWLMLGHVHTKTVDESLIHKPQSEGSEFIFGLGSPQDQARDLYIYIYLWLNLFLWAT